MKKLFFSLAFLLAFITPNFWFTQNNDLWNINFEFCWENQWKHKLSLSTSRWKNHTICMQFTNKSQKAIKINLDYPSLVKDQLWDSVCSIDNLFEQFITNIDDVKTLSIPAWTTITKDLDIFFPIWIEWNIWWCIAFYIQDNTETQWWTSQIKTILRQGFPIDIFVWTTESIKNEIEISNFTTNLDENSDLIISFKLTNIWNLSNNLIIKWNINNKFWSLNKNFEIEWWIIQPWQSISITKNIGWIWKSYWWLFDISLAVESTPHFEFDVSKSNIDPDLVETKEFEASTSFVQVPRLLLLTIAFGLSVIVLLIIKRR